MIRTFYVYQHRNPEGVIFYVGKGFDRRAWNQRGRSKPWSAAAASGFAVEIIVDSMTEELALLTEVELIDAYRRRGIALVNVTAGGDGVSGLRHTAETKAKIGAASTGRYRSPETCKKLSLANTGKTASAETRLKKSLAMLGRKRPQDAVEKTAAANRGRRHTTEARARMSVAQKGRIVTPEAARKTAEANKGRKHTDEARAKMAASHTGRRLSPETIAKRTATRARLAAERAAVDATNRSAS